MTIHYRYGGSTASRTLACSAWHGLADDMPRPPESKAAALGTALHSIIETCLLDVDHDPHAFSGMVVEKVLITDDNIDEKIYPALDEFESLMDTYDVDRYWCEVTACIAADVGGTADFVGLSTDGKTLVIADYKSGDGIMVFAEDNAQGLFYTMCMLADLKKRFVKLFKHVDKIIVAVVQPSARRAHPLDIWETTPARVQQFQKEYLAAVEESKTSTEPHAGKHCAFCPAEATCPAKTGVALEASRLSPDSLILAQLPDALIMADKLEGWIKSVRKLAHEQLENGAVIEGSKLVAKRAMRCWNDKPAVEKYIKNSKKIKTAEAYDAKLKSPAQIEKLCKSLGVEYAEFEPFVSAISSGTTLVSELDARPSVIATEAAKQVAARFA